MTNKSIQAGIEMVKKYKKLRPWASIYDEVIAIMTAMLTEEKEDNLHPHTYLANKMLIIEDSLARLEEVTYAVLRPKPPRPERPAVEIDQEVLEDYGIVVPKPLPSSELGECKYGCKCNKHYQNPDTISIDRRVADEFLKTEDPYYMVKELRRVLSL
jgi:hypothetical protein